MITVSLAWMGHGAATQGAGRWAHLAADIVGLVRSLQLVFLEDWLYATRQAQGAFHGQQLWPEDVPTRKQGSIDAQVLVSGPDSSWEAIHRLMVAAIHEARHRVWLVTPYFVPGEPAIMALTSAALRGVDVVRVTAFWPTGPARHVADAEAIGTALALHRRDLVLAIGGAAVGSAARASSVILGASSIPSQMTRRKK